MKTGMLFPALLSLAFLAMSCNDMNAPNASSGNPAADEELLLKNSGPSAHGQGSFTVDGEWRVFSFQAVTLPNGAVKGSGLLNRTPHGVRIQFDITCLTINDNVAIMQGVITKFPSQPEFVGGPCWFKVVDNGEGANADADEITIFLTCTPDDPFPLCNVPCGTDFVFIPLIPIEAGNIQVAP